MISWILGGAIFAYAAWVIRGRWRRMRWGCLGCSCEDCGLGCPGGLKEEKKDGQQRNL